MRHCLTIRSWTMFLLLAGVWLASAVAQETAKDKPPAISSAVDQVPPPPPNTWQRLSRQHDIWLDAKNQRVIVDGEVCLREGLLVLLGPGGTGEQLE